jgi:hypothetical protein
VLDRLRLGQHTGQLFVSSAPAEASCIRVFADKLSGKTSQSSGEYGAKFSRQPHIRSSDYIWQRSVKPSAALAGPFRVR